MATEAYLGLGSNLGSRILNCYRAIYQLHHSGSVALVERSSFYETEPYGYEEQNRFINLVLKIRTDLSPQALLCLTQSVEKSLGREVSFRWGPRVIDIDLLLFGDEQIEEEGLVIPHPQLHLRRFVLYPLAEIAPDLRHPALGKTISELLQTCPDRKEVRNLEPRGKR
ncbi:MAG: 2-amino-4-hydroxy-6-hydroxymethyldihydropteridine diphosphokinase [bacterium]|nr:2-amino-4-hydroxy-6-hydroxymethyldihydropteridine diphosphokinase [bacterium]